MHFNVIELGTKKIPREDRADCESLYEDPLVLQETDYVDSVKKYNDAIDTIAKEVEPFATINIHDGSYYVRMMSLISDYVFENSVPKVLHIGSIIDVHR